MDGWNEDFTENWFIRMFVVGNFGTPGSPFIFLYTPEIIIAKSTFREFDLD